MTRVEPEQILLREAVGSDRGRCVDCHRTPLAGEWIYLYGGRRPRLVCELCRIVRREAPLASAIVRDGPTGNVRITRRAAIDSARPWILSPSP